MDAIYSERLGNYTLEIVCDPDPTPPFDWQEIEFSSDRSPYAKFNIFVPCDRGYAYLPVVSSWAKELKTPRTVYHYIKDCLDELHQWETEDTYGIIVYRLYNEVVDSLWGLIGYDYALKEGLSMLEFCHDENIGGRLA